MLWMVSLAWAAEPVLDERVAWFGSEANLPGLPDPEVSLPSGTRYPSARLALTELLIVDAQGAQRRVALGEAPANPELRRVGLAFDRQLEVAAARDVIEAEARQGGRLFVVVRPEVPPQPRPTTPEIDAHRAKLCFGEDATQALSVELARISQSCPAGAAALPQLTAGSDLAAGNWLLEACPAEETAALALMACLWDWGIYRTDAAREGTRVLLVEIARSAVSLSSSGRWGERWASLNVQGGLIGGAVSDVRVFHHSELEVKKRVTPKYPEAALALKLGDQRCLVKVFIDETGNPFDAIVESCPKVFHEDARATLLGWRWQPPRNGKTPTRAMTTIALTYRVQP